MAAGSSDTKQHASTPVAFSSACCYRHDACCCSQDASAEPALCSSSVRKHAWNSEGDKTHSSPTSFRASAPLHPTAHQSDSDEPRNMTSLIFQLCLALLSIAAGPAAAASLAAPASFAICPGGLGLINSATYKALNASLCGVEGSKEAQGLPACKPDAHDCVQLLSLTIASLQGATAARGALSGVANLTSSAKGSKEAARLAAAAEARLKPKYAVVHICGGFAAAVERGIFSRLFPGWALHQGAHAVLGALRSRSRLSVNTCMLFRWEHQTTEKVVQKGGVGLSKAGPCSAGWFVLTPGLPVPCR